MMRTRMAAAAVAATMVLGGAACGGSGGQAASCEELADDAIEVIQGVLDETGDMSMEDVQGGEEPAFVQDLEEEGERLEEEAQELDCSEEEMTSLVAERTDQLEASGPVAELILEAVRQGEVFN